MTAQQGIKADNWTVAGRSFTSRLIVGTGKYKSLEENAAAVEASGAEIATAPASSSCFAAMGSSTQ